MRSHGIILKPRYVQVNKAKESQRNGRRQGERYRLRRDEEQIVKGIIDPIKYTGPYSMGNRESTETFKFSNVIFSYLVVRKLSLDRKKAESFQGNYWRKKHIGIC